MDNRKTVKRIGVFTIALVVSALLFALFFWVRVRHQREFAKTQADQTKIFMQTVLEREINVTDIMKSWLLTLGEDDMKRMQSEKAEGSYDHQLFERMASKVFEDDFIRALELQPDGVNSYVYPVTGNEELIGTDVFSFADTELRKTDAQKSKETGEILVTGPQKLRTGGEALLVRNPIYYGDGEFWGFSIVVLDVPGVFDSFGLNRLKNDHYQYEFYCYHENGFKHVIAENIDDSFKNPVGAFLQVADKRWELQIVPQGGWVPVKQRYLAAFLMILVSIIVTIVEEKLRDYHQNTMKSMRMQIEAETKAEVLEKEKERLETYDELTGCLNFHGFQVRCKMMIETYPQGHYAVSYFDIKQFKVFNELFGYEKGDDVLKFITHRLLESLGEYEIIGRVSGDAFVLLLHYEDDLRFGENFRNLYAQIEEYMDTNMSGFNLVIHAGVYILTEEDMQKTDVNKMVDNASYAQKSIKSPSFSQFAVYTGKYREEQVWKVQITKHLTAAIKNGEIAVWLQPQFNHETGQIIGAEALCRWNHNILGFLSPAKFIPVLEESGQITELDMFVWEEACRLMKKWEEQGKKISLSVNVSRHDVEEENIDQYLLELVDKYGLTPDRLNLEITESAYTENSKQLLEVVTRLRKLGFVIEMDDFGTGYSSLNMLKEIPVDILKLDMRFLSGEGDLVRGKKIVGSILQLAHITEIPVIAEGVETEEQAEHLIGIGCILMQGYYFSRPLPICEFEELLNTQMLGEIPKSFFVIEQLESELFAHNDLIPVGIIKYEANEEQRIRYVSSSLLRMLGYTRKEFVRKFENRFSNMVYKEDRQRVQEEIDEQMTWGKYDYCEYRVEAANGELIWVSDRGHLVKDDQGKPWFYVAIVPMGPTRQRNQYRDGSKEHEKSDKMLNI